MTLQSLDHAIATAEREFEALNSGRHEQGFWRELPQDVERMIGVLADELTRLRRFQAWFRVKSLLENKQFMDGMRKLH